MDRFSFSIFDRLYLSSPGRIVFEMIFHQLLNLPACRLTSIVTTMRYIHPTDQGKRGAIVVLSEYRQNDVASLSQTTNGRLFNLP
jgi:hypothetical protein